MATPAIVQSFQGTGTFSGSWTVNHFTTSPKIGNRIIVVVHAGGLVSSVTDSAGNTYVADTPSGSVPQVFSAPVTATAATFSVVLNMSSSYSNAIAYGIEVSGIGALSVASAEFSTSQGNGSFAAVQYSESQSVASTVAGGLVLGTWAQTQGAAGDPTPDASSTQIQTATLNSTNALLAEYQISTNGTETTGATFAIGGHSTSTLSGYSLVYAPAANIVDSSPAIEGVGAVTAATSAIKPSAASVDGVGSLSAATTKIVNSSASIDGVGAVTANTNALSPYSSVDIAGVGAVTANTSKIVQSSAVVYGVGAVSAQTEDLQQSSANVYGIGSMSAETSKVVSSSASIDGIGAISIQDESISHAATPALYVFSSAEALEAVFVAQDGANPTGTQTCPFYNAVHTSQLFNSDNATQGQVQDTLTFDVPADHPDAQYITKGAWVVYRNQSGTYDLFEITLTDEFDGSDGVYKTATCTQAAQAELIDEFIDSLTITSQAASTALSNVLSGTRWSVGNVTVAGTASLTLTQTNVLAALCQLVTSWGGELQFRVTISGSSIAGRYIDWLPQVGSTTGKRYEFGKDISSLQRTVDTTNLYTAVYPYGAIDQTTNKPINVSSVVWTTPTNPANKPSGQLYVSDPTAKAAYGRAGGTRDRYTSYTDSNQTDASKLLQEGWDYLQTINAPTVTYQISAADLSQVAGYAHEKVSMGDTVNVIDTGLQPAIQQQMRVIQLNRDLVNPLNTQVTLGAFRPTTVTTASTALTALENASAAAAQAALAQTAADNAQTTANSAKTTADSALQPGSTIDTSWLSGIISADQNALQSAGGYVTVDSNGITILNASSYASATAALQLSGGIFGIANAKNGSGGWNWQTFGTGNGFDASKINTGELDASLIRGGTLLLGGSGNSYGTLVIENGSGSDLVSADNSGTRIYDPYNPVNVHFNSSSSSLTVGNNGYTPTNLYGNSITIDSAGTQHYIANSTDGIYITSDSNGIVLRPTTANTGSCGTASQPWKLVEGQSVTTSSSREWKEAIRDHTIAESVKLIRELQIKKYAYTNDATHTEKIGLIAEDAPVEVSFENRAIDLYQLLSHLTAAVQDLQKRVYGEV